MPSSSRIGPIVSSPRSPWLPAVLALLAVPTLGAACFPDDGIAEGTTQGEAGPDATTSGTTGTTAVDDTTLTAGSSTTVGPDSTSGATTDPTTGVPDPTTGTSDASETGTSDASSSSTSEDPIVPECVANDGAEDVLCPSEEPFCLEGVCVACTDLLDPDLSCESANGETPVCDAGTGACIPCSEHAQCGERACHLGAGECFPPDTVLYVNIESQGCIAGDGSADNPYCDLMDALDHVEAYNPLMRWTIRVQQAGLYSQLVFKTPPDSTLAVIADDAPVSIQSTAEPSIANVEVGSKAALFLSGVDMSFHKENGVACMSGGGSFWVEKADIVGNGINGVRAVDCNAYIRRSVITSNGRGGLEASGLVAATLDNVFLTDNGSTESSFGGIQASNGTELAVRFSTLVNNQATLGMPSSLRCVNVKSVEFRNSIAIGFALPSVACTDADTQGSFYMGHSALDEGAPNGPGNLTAFPGDGDQWFWIDFPGKYRPFGKIEDESSPLMDLAIWSSGDPSGDFEGDPRPVINGTEDVAGADIP